MGAGGDLGGGMVDIQRLIRLALVLCAGVLFGGFSVYAFADDYPGVPEYSWNAQTVWHPTAIAAGDAYASVSPYPCGAAGTYVDWSLASGSIVKTYPGTGGSATTYALCSNGSYKLWSAIRRRLSCPGGGVLSGGVCVGASACETGIRGEDGQCFTCPDGRTWNGSTCESPCQAKAGNSYGTANSWAMLDVDTVPSGAPTFCDGSCSVTGGKVECESDSAGGTSGDRISLGSTCTVQGPFTYTGQGCGPGGSAPMLVGVDDVEKPWWDKGLEQKDCSAQGGYWGNVNGIDACVRPQPGETFDKETSTGNDTSGTTETAADGTTTEKSTTTTTECKDGKCTTTTTTTTTTKGADGQQIGEPTTETKSETKPEADFCKANPQHAQCAGTQTGGSFSGGCTTGFACTGDAVQCAIARAAHTEACNQKAIADDAQGFMDGLGAVEPTEAKLAEALNREGEFDFDIAEAFQDAQQNYVTFTASCLPPMGFTFKGQTYSFNTGFICEIGDFVRLMLHLIAYMTVLRVISRAFG